MKNHAAARRGSIADGGGNRQTDVYLDTQELRMCGEGMSCSEEQSGATSRERTYSLARPALAINSD